jgi:hypothetical protein
MPESAESRIVTWFCILLLSVAYAGGLLLSLGVIEGLNNIYPASEPYLSLQASAFSRGQLELSSCPSDLAFDLAWGPDGVQQVWGLGVPIWLFSLSVVTGESDPLLFPSRIAFGLWLCVVAFVILVQVVFGTRNTLEDYLTLDWKYFAVVVPTVSILLFFPSFSATLKSCFRVYEEISAYGYLYALFLSVLLGWFSYSPSPVKVFLLGLAAGAAPFVRPTLAIYGLSSVVLALWIIYKTGLLYRMAWSLLLPYLCLLMILLWTNWMRFGTPLEFGHKLNMTYHVGSLYSTRFGTPFKNEPIAPALQELCGGLLFHGNFNYGRWFTTNVFVGQSQTLRWRENYLPPIGWPLIGLAIAGTIVSFWGTFPICNRKRQTLNTLFVHSAASSLGLTAVYLRFPVMSSRYFYDFAPAFAIAAAAAWWCVSQWALKKTSLSTATTGFFAIGVCFYLCFRAHAASSSEYDAVSCTRSDYEILINRYTSPIGHLNPISGNLGMVEIKSKGPNADLGIPFEGFGWNRPTGNVSAASIHFVHDIQFLELEIARTGIEGHPRPYIDWIRVKVGLEELVREHVKEDAGRLTIKFHPPNNKRYIQGVHPLFISWVPPELIGVGDTPWLLKKITWRQSDP